MNRNRDEAPIRELMDRFAKSIRAKDINGVMAVFDSAVVSFDLGPPLRHGGGQEFITRWQQLFASYQGAIDFEVRDLRIALADDVAFSYSVNKMSGTMQNGEATARWLRWTACYRKTRDQWLIVHEHVSVPVDVKSGKAAVNLNPDDQR